MDDIPPEAARYTDQSLSTIHHALRASRRRLAVVLVAYRVIRTSATGTSTADEATTDEIEVSVRQIAKEIVVIEEETPPEQATGEPYHNRYNSLNQTHLPELDRVGAIEYNADRKQITPDRNLLALAMVAAITSPLAQTLFHAAVADLGQGGPPGQHNSIGD
jgi:phage tail tube protein FII